ncbi:hypothetical protein [Nocardioides taihuensis]|uniref:Uncharacterized protein n=1 Tax=Nocardioides taihuensis TaxID=1835606 RepID=A0ABW0BJA3_9ACTN
MKSSGMKRGLAAVAVSALAVVGAPFLATSASATPLADQIDTSLGSDQVVLYTPYGCCVSIKDDGQNTTASLLASAGSDVTSVVFQYSTDSGTTWTDIGSPVARNADGVFGAEWANPPANLTHVRAVGGPGGDTAQVAIPFVPDASDAVEMSSEGNLGVFQAPYTGHDGDYVGIRGTVSDGGDVFATWNMSDGHPAFPGVNATEHAQTGADSWDAVLDITGYPYSAGAEVNQVVFGSYTNQSHDAEGSTLYVQEIGSITATPSSVEVANDAATSTTLTVKDTTGKPVAGAEVGLADLDTDGAGPDTDGPDTIVGYTDGNGEIVADVPSPSSGTYTYFVNTTDNDEYQSAVDKATTFTVTSYTPVLDKVDIVNNWGRSNVDIDELSDGDDFTVVTLDQRGNGLNEDLAGNDVEYRWVFDPSGAGATTTTAWFGGETNADGEFDVPAPTDAMAGGQLPEGDYTLEARRPNVGGAGLKNAVPETFAASESEISYQEDASANAPVNGSFTVNANLANDGGGLGGREVHLTYSPDADSAFAPQASQPAGVTRIDATHATVITDADGDFSVALKDPAVPPNVTPTPEDGTLNALAYEGKGDGTSLQGDLGPNDPTDANQPANAEQDLAIHFIVQPEATDITVDTDALYTEGGGQYGPGRPADLDITVFGADGPDAGTDPDELQDFPVTVSVDKGFLSPNAESAGDLVLADGHDAAGDLWGFFENLGTEVQTSTGDDAEAGAVAAIERDPGFDADGLSQMTVTVKAGDVTKTVTLDLDARDPINTPEIALDRADGEPTGKVTVGKDLEFNLWAHDQYGNVVGDQFARISDDSTVADFDTDEDFDQTLSDFTTSTPGIVAFSDAPATQVLTAEMQQQKTVVDDAGDPTDTYPTTMTDSAPITWVKKTIEVQLKGKDNGGKDDVLTVDGPKSAAGATVKLYKVKADGSKKLLKTSTLNGKGNKQFTVNDKNGNDKTKYVAKVSATDTTKKATSNKKSVR